VIAGQVRDAPALSSSGSWRSTESGIRSVSGSAKASRRSSTTSYFTDWVSTLAAMDSKPEEMEAGARSANSKAPAVAPSRFRFSLDPGGSAAKGNLDRAAGVDSSAAAASIETATAPEYIGATVPHEFIISSLTEQAIVACAADNLVGAGAAVGAIAPTAGKNIVRSAPSADNVIAPAAYDVVVPSTGDDHVPARSADKIVRPRGTDDRRTQALALRLRLSTCHRSDGEGGRNQNRHRDDSLRGDARSTFPSHVFLLFVSCCTRLLYRSASRSKQVPLGEGNSPLARHPARPIPRRAPRLHFMWDGPR
jgi:hypothetical protein